MEQDFLVPLTSNTLTTRLTLDYERFQKGVFLDSAFLRASSSISSSDNLPVHAYHPTVPIPITAVSTQLHESHQSVPLASDRKERG